MNKRIVTLLLSGLMLVICGAAQSTKAGSSPAPDKAYLEKMLAGWNTLDPANVAQYYAQGPYTFFDVAPVKYNSWDEYAAGVKKLLADYKTFTLTLNDDAAIHPHGDLVWATATLKEDATTTSGKHEMATLRWTVVFAKQGGKWLIVHEHVSQPLQ